MPQVAIGGLLVGGAAASLAGGFSIAGAFAAGGLVTSVAQFGAGLILSGIAQEFIPKPSFGNRARTTTIRQPVEPRSVIYGRARVGGVLVFISESGGGNEYLHLVIAIASHSVQKIGAVYFNGEEAIDDSGTPVSAYASNVLIEKNLGTTSQSAFPQLIADLPSQWTTTHRGRGIASVHIRLKFNADLFPTGIPEITFDIEGKNDVYDPRTLTSGYSENPALCIADYMSLTDFSIGAGIGDEDGINEASLIEAANICDETVGLAGSAFAPLLDESDNALLDESGNELLGTNTVGGSEARYTCNGVITLDQAPQDIIRAMLTSCAGYAIWRGTDWNIQAGAYRTPTVTLTDRDVREAGLALDTRVTRSENFNGVRGQFVSPENDWQPDDFPAYQSATYVSEDGEENWADIALPFTLSAPTAQRLAKIKLEEQRRQQSARFSGQLRAYRAVTGENVMFDRARWGYVAKPFRVKGTSLSLENNALVVDLNLRETSPLIWTWNSTEEQVYAAAPSTNLPNPLSAPAPGVPSLSEELYQTRDGAGVRVLIRGEWLASDSVFVTEYQVQARRVLDEDGVATGDEFVTQGRTDQLFWEIRDVQPGQWEFRVKGLTELGVSSSYATATIDVLGLIPAPGDVTGLQIQGIGGQVYLEWDSTTDLDVRIGGKVVIRHSNSGSPSWANSVFMKEVSGSQDAAAVPQKPGTYLVRFKDSSGTLSATAATVSTDGIQAVEFANVTTLTAEPIWSGTKTNTEIDTSSLKLTNTSTTGTYEFTSGMDFGLVKRVRLRSDIDVSALDLSSLVDDWTDIDSRADFDGTDGAEIDVLVEVRTTKDDPTGSPVWGPWGRLDSSEVEAWGVEGRATLSTANEDFNAFLSGLSLIADEVV